MALRTSRPRSPTSKNEDSRIALGPRAILCAVVDANALGAEPCSRARSFFDSGVDWIQLRDRSIDDHVLWRITRALVDARDAENQNPDSIGGKRVIVNKRVDLVHAAGADGAHLGFDALPRERSRAFLGGDALLGVSLHSVEEVVNAATGAIDYCHLAPIWDPLSKPATRPALGLDTLAQACRSGLPVLAQGGIDPDHARAAIRVGAAGIAVTGTLQSTRNPSDAIRKLRESLDEGQQNPVG
jgi:thiamine-phosphate pyrophosphorylase